MMAISKRLRFEILRRDNNTCQYCGGKVPDVELTIDHVTPVALGGSDEPTNLVAACKDCNAGKSSASPDATFVEQVARDSAMWDQAKAAAAEGRKATMFVGFDDEIEIFRTEWDNWQYPDDTCAPRDPDWKTSIRVWLLRGLTLETLLGLIPVVLKRNNVAHHDRWRYFCGCAWNTLTELEEAAAEIYAEMRNEV